MEGRQLFELGCMCCMSFYGEESITGTIITNKREMNEEMIILISWERE